MKMQPGDQEGQAHHQGEQEETADNQEEHPKEQNYRKEEQSYEEKLQMELEQLLKEQLIHDDCPDVNDSEKEEADEPDVGQNGGKDVKEQGHVAQLQNKQEEQLLNQREQALDHQCDCEETGQLEKESKDAELSEGQELLKMAAERKKQLRREADQQLLKEEQLMNKEEQLRKEEEQHRKEAEKQLLKEEQLRKGI